MGLDQLGRVASVVIENQKCPIKPCKWRFDSLQVEGLKAIIESHDEHSPVWLALSYGYKRSRLSVRKVIRVMIAPSSDPTKFAHISIVVKHAIRVNFEA